MHNFFTSKNSKKQSFFYGLTYFFAETLNGLLLLPLISSHLTEEAATSWILFLGAWPIAPLMLSGFSQLLTREVAKAAQRESSECVSAFIRASRQLTNYALMALFPILIIITLFVSFDTSILLSWAFFCVAIFSRLEFLRVASILNGLGWIGNDKLIMSLAAYSFLALSTSLVIFGFDLKAITFAFAFCQAIAAIGINIFAKKITASIQLMTLNKTENAKLSLKEITKMYAISISGFMTMNIDIFIAKYFLDPEDFIEYGFLSRIILATIAIIGMYIQLGFPKLASLSHRAQLQLFRSEAKRQTSTAVSLAVAITVLIALSYRVIISNFLGHPPNLNQWSVTFFCAFAVFAIYIISKGQSIIALGDNKLVYISIPMSFVSVATAATLAHSYGPQGLTAGLASSLLLSSFLHMKMFKDQYKRSEKRNQAA